VKIKNKKYKGLMHFGFVETFNRPPSMEIFIQDFSGDLYGQILEIQVMKKLRDIIKFNTIKELKTQIEEDIKALK
jgi:riboflavin kinase/FMN adenylyltransferase